MEMWMKISLAIMFGIMAFTLFPRARQMLKESPKGSSDDWRTFLLIIAFVTIFIVLLVALV
jgi:nitrate reductase NapE component